MHLLPPQPLKIPSLRPPVHSQNSALFTFNVLFQDISRGWSVQLKFHFSQFVTQSFHAWIIETQHTTRCTTHNTFNYPFSTCKISNTWSALLGWNTQMLIELTFLNTLSLRLQFLVSIYKIVPHCCSLLGGFILYSYVQQLEKPLHLRIWFLVKNFQELQRSKRRKYKIFHFHYLLILYSFYLACNK